MYLWFPLQYGGLKAASTSLYSYILIEKQMARQILQQNHFW